MAKIAIRLRGFEIEFEGDDTAWAQFAKFVSGDLQRVVDGLGVARGTDDGPGGTPDDDTSNGGAGDSDAPPPPPPPPGTDALNPRAVEARMKEVGASTDIDRVTVMAQAAVDAGLPGLDYPTVGRLYTALALRKPPTWRATFSNAKQRGYIESVAQGVWKPTVPGENFARYGDRKSTTGKRRKAAPGERLTSDELAAPVRDAEELVEAG